MINKWNCYQTKLSFHTFLFKNSKLRTYFCHTTNGLVDQSVCSSTQRFGSIFPGDNRNKNVTLNSKHKHGSCDNFTLLLDPIVHGCAASNVGNSHVVGSAFLKKTIRWLPSKWNTKFDSGSWKEEVIHWRPKAVACTTMKSRVVRIKESLMSEEGKNKVCPHIT